MNEDDTMMTEKEAFAELGEQVHFRHGNWVKTSKSPTAGKGTTTAIRLAATAAETDPERFFELADIYSDGDETARKQAAKYDALGFKMGKRLKEMKIREMRLHAQMRRICGKTGLRLSSKTRREMRLADFCTGFEEIKRYRHWKKAQ